MTVNWIAGLPERTGIYWITTYVDHYGVRVTLAEVVRFVDEYSKARVGFSQYRNISPIGDKWEDGSRILHHAKLEPPDPLL